MILLADLHLKTESADVCFDVLNAVADFAINYDEDKTIALLGDTLHVRHLLPVELLNRLSDFIFTRTKQGLQFRIIAGNHDQVDVQGQHALQVFSGFSNVTIYHEPQEDEFGLWLPYRRDIAPLLQAIEKSSAKLCYAHHGLVGALMNSGIIAGELDGLPPSYFDKFSCSFFGHWHKHQIINKCVYIGSPWQTRIDEAGQQKGFIHLVRSSGWSFIPLSIGPKYFIGDASNAGKGDIVRVDHSVSQKSIAQLHERGVEVRIDPPPFVSQGSRSGLEKNTPIRQHAAFYVEKNAGELSHVELMKLFDEVAS